MIAIEKRIAEQEQYYRRETVELVGLPDNTNDEELEDAVIKTFDEAGVKVTKKSFHASCNTQIAKQKSGNNEISKST